MKRRCNFTGRKEIPTRCLKIELNGNERRIVDLEWSSESLEFPTGCHVYLDVTSSRSAFVQRFAWGTVGIPEKPENCVLSEQVGDAVSCRVMFVDESEDLGRIRGVSKDITPGQRGQKECAEVSMLWVNPVDLGEQIWRLNFDDKMPILEVNKQIENVLGLIKTDKLFFGMVFPSVIRQVFTEIMLCDPEYSFDEIEDTWSDKWLRWGAALHVYAEPPPEKEADIQVRKDWIEGVCEGFGKKHSILQEFNGALDQWSKTK